MAQYIVFAATMREAAAVLVTAPTVVPGSLWRHDPSGFLGSDRFDPLQSIRL
jgi:hypothetical protein